MQQKGESNPSAGLNRVLKSRRHVCRGSGKRKAAEYGVEDVYELEKLRFECGMLYQSTESKRQAGPGCGVRVGEMWEFYKAARVVVGKAG